MKLPTSARSFLLCAVAIFAGARSWALPSVHEVAVAVDSYYNHLRSLQADFTEIYQGSGVEREETGVLWLKKPGKMRWHYRSPQEKLFVSNGGEAWLYLPAEKQARKSSLKELEDLRSPLAFLLGKAKLEKELDGLSFAPDVQPWQAGDAVLRGIPRRMEDRVRQVLIEITPQHRIVRIVVQATDDSTTEYRFSNLKENVSLSDREFQFVPPPDSEVVQDPAQTGG